MPWVRFHPEDVVVEVEVGDAVAEAVLKAHELHEGLFRFGDLWWDPSSHGFVEVLEGQDKLTARSPTELEAMRDKGIPASRVSIRQMCNCYVMGDVTLSILRGPRGIRSPA